MKLSLVIVRAAYKWVLGNANIAFGLDGLFLLQFEICLVLDRVTFNENLGNLSSYKTSWGTGKMAQQLRSPAALLEVLRSIPSNYMMTHNHL